LVLDGCVRDPDPLRRLRFPVFCRGLSVRGTTKVGAGRLREPLPVGDVTVRDGDLVLGDENGVVVVPAAEAPAILEKARARDAWEERVKADLAAGRLTIDLLGLREILKQKGLDPGPAS
jgi:4-hydroxy-4-methyl-2-oxoglutarate aldolase